MECDVDTLASSGPHVALSSMCASADEVSRQSPQPSNRLSSEVTQILDDIRRAVLGNPEEARPATLRLVTLLASPSSGERSKGRGGLAPWKKRKIDRSMRENLEHPLRADELAEQVSLTTGYFNRAFEETFGESPHAIAQGLMLSTGDAWARAVSPTNRISPRYSDAAWARAQTCGAVSISTNEAGHRRQGSFKSIALLLQSASDHWGRCANFPCDNSSL